MKTLRKSGLILLTSLFVGLTYLCRADSIDPAQLKEDPRLAKPVSAHSRRIALKDLLDDFAAQTGVDIYVDKSDPASSYPVFVECTDCDASRAMSALYSLFSIRGGEWAWVRLGKPGAYSYIFRETPAAKNRTATYDRIRRNMLQNYVDLLRRMVPMKMEQRKALRGEFRRTLFIDNDAMLNSFFTSEAFWNQANFFFRSLDEKQQSAVLDGGSASVEFRSLPPDVREMYKKNFSLAYDDLIAQDASVVIPDAPPEPASVTFFHVNPNHKIEQLATRIDITMPFGAESWMGTGHLEFGIRDALKAAWILKGDSLSSPKCLTKVEASKETDEESRELKLQQEKADKLRSLFPALADRVTQASGTGVGLGLAQLSRGASTPVFAILPVEERIRPRSPVGQSVGMYLASLEGNLKLYFCKWRDDVLLVTTPIWFAQATEAIPYYLLATLHPDANGNVPPMELAVFMGRLSNDQAEWFAEEHQIREAKALRACLSFIGRNPGALRPGGVGIDPENDGKFLAELRISPEAYSHGDRPFARMLLKSLPMADGGRRIQVLQVELYERDRAKWIPVTNVPYPSFMSGARTTTSTPNKLKDTK